MQLLIRRLQWCAGCCDTICLLRRPGGLYCQVCVYGKIFCFILKICFQLNTMTAVTAVLRLTTSADHPSNDRNTSLFTYANHPDYIWNSISSLTDWRQLCQISNNTVVGEMPPNNSNGLTTTLWASINSSWPSRNQTIDNLVTTFSFLTLASLG